MIKLSKKEKNIVSIFLKKEELQSSDLHEDLTDLGEEIALVTIKRHLTDLSKKGVLEKIGSGRSTHYILTVLGRVFADVNAKDYVSIDPDDRYGLKSYNFNLLKEFPLNIFNNKELQSLEKLTNEYRKRVEDISETIQKKELERLVIELSWKSSKIEGNTYTLLDTENLLLNDQPAKDKTKEETQMIINHKDAFNFIYNKRNNFKEFNLNNLEKLHDILIKDLGVDTGLRKSLVGVTGSIYKPLDNFYQIKEAVNDLSDLINKLKNPFAKSIMAILGISYIQPFGDGNKRTSRMMANALLLAYNCAPLSYRSVDEEEYRSAMLVFYELNSIKPFKDIFIKQYEFAAKNYNVK